MLGMEKHNLRTQFLKRHIKEKLWPRPTNILNFAGLTSSPHQSLNLDPSNKTVHPTLMSKAESDTLARGPSVSLSVFAGIVELWDGRGREPPISWIGDTNCSSMMALGSLRPLRTSLEDESFSPVKKR